MSEASLSFQLAGGFVSEAVAFDASLLNRGWSTCLRTPRAPRLISVINFVKPPPKDLVRWLFPSPVAAGVGFADRYRLIIFSEARQESIHGFVDGIVVIPFVLPTSANIIQIIQLIFIGFATDSE